jgi:hypothetical protein
MTEATDEMLKKQQTSTKQQSSMPLLTPFLQKQQNTELIRPVA